MKAKVKVVKEIERCYDCPFFDEPLSEGPRCCHPLIIRRIKKEFKLVMNVCNKGFPKECPLFTCLNCDHIGIDGAPEPIYICCHNELPLA